MSFTIYWEKLDKRVAQSVQTQLNAFFHNLTERPGFLGEITVEHLDFGSVPPHLEIIDLTEPYPEFYLATEEDAANAVEDGVYSGVDDDLESALSRVSDRPVSQATVRSLLGYGNPMDALFVGSGAQTPVPRIWTTNMGAGRLQTPRVVVAGEPVVEPSADDLQLLARVEYSGDMSVVLRTELQLNYPASQFASLPVALHITRIEFSAVAVVAYLRDRINFCFLEPVPPRTSLLDSFSIRTEIGDAHHHVLKNVEKLELFITEQLRRAIDDEFVFPAYHSFEL